MQDRRESLRLISLNIEGQRHLKRVGHFLATAPSDVVLLQEVFESDAKSLGGDLGMNYAFGPMCRRPLDYKSGDPQVWGVAMLSRHPLETRVIRYGGDPNDIPELKIGPRGEPLVHAARTLILGEVKKNEVPFNIATTHFTWSDNGAASDQQRLDVKELLRGLEGIPEVVLAGDFNSPRGGEIYNTICKRYLDRLPQHIKATIDGKFHRAGFLQLVVDHLFTSPGYEASNVRLVNGLSDHWGVIARIHRAQS